jgi:hypothetical protein
MAQIVFKLNGCQLGIFSTLKFINSQNFIKFRAMFKAEFKSGFMVHANTFDNVKGQFPISFTVWNVNETHFPQEVTLSVPEEGGTKKYWSTDNQSINDWLNTMAHGKKTIGWLNSKGVDFQNNQGVWISNENAGSGGAHFPITETNLIECCIYFTVRHLFEHTWLNHNDQFLTPHNTWRNDGAFQTDCIMYTLFHGKNRITSNDGVNHWIPFTSKELMAKDKIASSFMADFLQQRGKLSQEAQAVFDAGLDLWKYYHTVIKTNNTAHVNASYYDIREFFQGRNEKGTMNSDSSDSGYNEKNDALKARLKTLNGTIAPNVYEYGFLHRCVNE